MKLVVLAVLVCAALVAGAGSADIREKRGFLSLEHAPVAPLAVAHAPVVAHSYSVSHIAKTPLVVAAHAPVAVAHPPLWPAHPPVWPAHPPVWPVHPPVWPAHPLWK